LSVSSGKLYNSGLCLGHSQGHSAEPSGRVPCLCILSLSGLGTPLWFLASKFLIMLPEPRQL
jgi:hypothetical protein